MGFRRQKEWVKMEAEIRDWQQRCQQLDAQWREAQLALKQQDVLHRQVVQAKEAQIQALRKQVQAAADRVERAREEARNAKERAKRLKRREIRLLAERNQPNQEVKRDD